MNLYNNPYGTTIVKSTQEKTKKKKQSISSEQKRNLWATYEKDKTNKTTGPDKEMECVYEKENREVTNVCEDCNGPLRIMDDGLPTCMSASCGRIFTDVLDYSPEWRYFGSEDKNANDPSRCGNPINPLLEQSSYGCKVLCSPKCSYEMKKIRQWIEWQSMPHREKSLYDEFQFITIMAVNAGIPKIFIDSAMAIHKDISEQKIFRGLNRDGIKAASIYISCRLNGCPRTSHEIAEIFHLDKASATNGCSMATNILNNIDRGEKSAIRSDDLCATTPSAFIERYCSKLSMSQELIMVAKFVAAKLEQGNLINDNTPHSIAAGIIYFVAENCRLNMSKTDIRQVCNVSEVTINKCYKKMEAMKDQILPKTIVDKYTK
jgi:transcription initiation factor TFIIB